MPVLLAVAVKERRQNRKHGRAGVSGLGGEAVLPAEGADDAVLFAGALVEETIDVEGQSSALSVGQVSDDLAGEIGPAVEIGGVLAEPVAQAPDHRSQCRVGDVRWVTVDGGSRGGTFEVGGPGVVEVQFLAVGHGGVSDGGEGGLDLGNLVTEFVELASSWQDTDAFAQSVELGVDVFKQYLEVVLLHDYILRRRASRVLLWN